MIHHIGTFARDLLEGYIEAASAVREAIRAMAETRPNARHCLKRLNAVREELEQLAESGAVRL